MAGPRVPTMQVTLLSGAAGLLAAGCARNVADARRERLENGIEILDRMVGPTDHHAVAAIQPPDAAAGANIDVTDALGRQLVAPANVVDVIGVAAVDQDVIFLQPGSKFVD